MCENVTECEDLANENVDENYTSRLGILTTQFIMS